MFDTIEYYKYLQTRIKNNNIYLRLDNKDEIDYYIALNEDHLIRTQYSHIIDPYVYNEKKYLPLRKIIREEFLSYNRDKKINICLAQ